MTPSRSVLISGASVAGPTLAYWLRRHGFTPTVLERTPGIRAGLGGHAVDLFGPAVEIAQRMKLLPQVWSARTMTEVLSLERPGKRPVEVDAERLTAGIADRHVEIMRGELAAILYEATRNDVEYVFGDSIRSIEESGDGVQVTFEHGAPRSFDLVVGADGLHSNVRRLRFGEESQFRHYLGGYLAAFSVPNYRALSRRMVIYNSSGRLAGMYAVRQTDQARAVLLFRRTEELEYDHRDRAQQRELVRAEFAGEGWEVPRLLAELDPAADFYLDSISQILMDSWSKGRVTLVGDAGYSPAPAVGGGTSLAMIGAYVLAGELSAARGEHATAFRGYEGAMGDVVRRFRTVGPFSMRTLIPQTSLQIRLMPHLMRLVSRLPAALQRKLWSLQEGPARALSAASLKDYGSER